MYPRFLVQFDSRLREFHAVQRGEATDTASALEYFGLRTPLTVDSIRSEKRSAKWHYLLRDSTGKALRTRLGAEAASASATLYGATWQVNEEGTSVDRYVLALTSMALRQDSTVTAAKWDRARADLVRAVRLRTSRIIAEDNTRPWRRWGSRR